MLCDACAWSMSNTVNKNQPSHSVYSSHQNILLVQRSCIHSQSSRGLSRFYCNSYLNDEYKIQVDCTGFWCLSTRHAVNWVPLSLPSLFCASILDPHPHLNHILSLSLFLALSHKHVHQRVCCLVWAGVGYSSFMRSCWGVERLQRWGVREMNSPLPLLCEGSACCTPPR